MSSEAIMNKKDAIYNVGEDDDIYFLWCNLTLTISGQVSNISKYIGD